MDTGSGTSTQTQKSEPWSASQPYLRDIFGQAQQQYRAGQEYFPGSAVVPFHPDTEQGLQGLRQQFNQTPMGLDTAKATMDRLSQGTTGTPLFDQMKAASGASTTAGTGMISGSAGANPFLSNLNSAANQQTTAGTGALAQMSAGGQNPYLDSVFDNAAKRVRDNTNAMFSNAGRYGSTANQQALSDSLGSMAAQMYGNAYESDQGRRLAASQTLGSMQANDLSRNLSGASALAGLGESQFGRMAGAGGALAGIQANDLSRQVSGLSSAANYGLAGDQMAMGAASAYPGLYNYSQAGNRGLMEIGGVREGLAQQQLQDQMNRWNFGQNAGWDQLGRYNSIVQPIAALGQQGTTTSPTQSAMGRGLQGAAGGAMMGSTFGAPGAIIGGGLGALGGLLG